MANNFLLKNLYFLIILYTYLLKIVLGKIHQKSFYGIESILFETVVFWPLTPNRNSLIAQILYCLASLYASLLPLKYYEQPLGQVL